MLWLARKAFLGHLPFPAGHIDTSFKIPEMIEFRDRMAKEWKLDLIVGQNKAALADVADAVGGRCGWPSPPDRTTVSERCGVSARLASGDSATVSAWSGVIVSSRHLFRSPLMIALRLSPTMSSIA